MVCVSVCTGVQFLWFVFQCELVFIFVVCVSVCTGVQFLWPVFQCAPVFSFCGFVFECAPVFSFCGLCFSVHQCSVFVVCVSVCTQLLTASIPDDDSLQLFFQLIDKCLQHEVRTCSFQPLYITAWTA